MKTWIIITKMGWDYEVLRLTVTPMTYEFSNHTPLLKDDIINLSQGCLPKYVVKEVIELN